MKLRNRSLAFRIGTCIGVAALAWAAPAAADHRDGRGWRAERHDGHRDGGRHDGWRGQHRGYAESHRHGPGCGHGGYAYRPYRHHGPPRGHAYGYRDGHRHGYGYGYGPRYGAPRHPWSWYFWR